MATHSKDGFRLPEAAPYHVSEDDEDGKEGAIIGTCIACAKSLGGKFADKHFETCFQ